MVHFPEKKPCQICLLMDHYNWSEDTKKRFNLYVKNNITGSVTIHARKFIKNSFSQPDDDLINCSFFKFKRHINQCIPINQIADNVFDILPKEQEDDYNKPVITKAEVNKLLSDFRKLNFEDKTNTLLENWKEIVAVLMLHTKKSVERRVAGGNPNIVTLQDVTVSKIIVDTFKILGQERFYSDVNQPKISYKGKDINFFKNILEDESS